MRIKIDYRAWPWWYWTLTLAALVAGFAGLAWGFALALGISVAQTAHFFWLRGATAFPSRVRLVYTVFVAIALFDPSRLFFAALTFGAAMVVLFDRRFIARVLVRMPWNKGVRLS